MLNNTYNLCKRFLSKLLILGSSLSILLSSNVFADPSTLQSFMDSIYTQNGSEKGIIDAETTIGPWFAVRKLEGITMDTSFSVVPMIQDPFINMLTKLDNSQSATSPQVISNSEYIIRGELVSGNLTTVMGDKTGEVRIIAPIARAGDRHGMSDEISYQDFKPAFLNIDRNQSRIFPQVIENLDLLENANVFHRPVSLRIFGMLEAKNRSEIFFATNDLEGPERKTYMILQAPTQYKRTARSLQLKTALSFIYIPLEDHALFNTPTAQQNVNYGFKIKNNKVIEQISNRNSQEMTRESFNLVTDSKKIAMMFEKSGAVRGPMWEKMFAATRRKLIENLGRLTKTTNYNQKGNTHANNIIYSINNRNNLELYPKPISISSDNSCAKVLRYGLVMIKKSK